MSQNKHTDALGLPDDDTKASINEGQWKILVVDDEQDVHSVTNIVLQHDIVLGRKIRLLHAYSGTQAIQILKAEPDIALILLDVVMETDDDGLMVAAYVRLSSTNPHTRIVMRTGQPGVISEQIAAEDFQVNYYEPKSQLTAERLRAIVHMAIDAYHSSVTLAQANAQLKTTLSDLELFSNAVAHDLKTPGRQIALLADMLLEDLPVDTPRETRELAAQIGDASRRLLQMTDELLDLSRLGKDSLNFSELTAAELLDNVLNDLRFNLRDEKIDIQVEVDPEIMLHVDSEKFKHVIKNIVENSCKYRSKERILNVLINVKRNLDSCEIEISDNGTGIEESMLDSIFLPFRRAANGDEVGGSGIGLAICKRIVELHDGTIYASSTKGDGTTICITLPAT